MTAYNLQTLATRLTLILVGDIELYCGFCQQCKLLSFMLLQFTH